MEEVLPHLFLFRDTCHVYALVGAARTVLVDFGSGDVLDETAARGLPPVTDVLMTHHHRDQGQGLPRAVAAGIRIWAPHTEQDLFHSVDTHWQAREVRNNYNMRQDRFSLLEPVPLAGTLRDYETLAFDELRLEVLPTPGHTTGSITLLAELDGRRVAFTGDLIAGPGQLWSLAATQWSYNGGEGIALSIFSLDALKRSEPEWLLPSHGLLVQEDAAGAIDLLVARLARLLQERRQNPRLFELLAEPYEQLSAHLLMNRTSMANSYVLLSESGKALFIDYGYDCIGGVAAGSDRASRRPWLYTLPQLKAQFGVTKVDVALPTHFHDDHVAGLNLLRDVEGTQVWAAANFAPILEAPQRYNLPCLWYDPIAVDRVLPLEETFRWEEYELTLYPLPGHTRYAVAIAFEVDGVRVLATGDQYSDEDGQGWNYVYGNGFAVDDYRASAALYRGLAPELILSGHWPPLRVAPGYLEMLEARGETLAWQHRELLPPAVLQFGAEGFAASIEPYEVTVEGGESVQLTVAVNGDGGSGIGDQQTAAAVRLAVPEGWRVEPEAAAVALGGSAVFVVTPPVGLQVRRERVAADVTIGDWRLGQQAEALVSVGDRGSGIGDRQKVVAARMSNPKLQEQAGAALEGGAA
jgi:glyoxylase-like metal-dependent hydrolase (beta-lactamase superfamily II)